MKCINCGTKINGNESSCPNCGEVLSVSRNKKEGRTTVLLSLLIITLLALLAYTIYLTVSFFVNGDQIDYLYPSYTMTSRYQSPDRISTTPIVEDNVSEINTNKPTPLGGAGGSVEESVNSEPVTQPVNATVQTVPVYLNPKEVSTTTPIMGKSSVKAADLSEYYKKYSKIEFPSYYRERGVSLDDFTQIYIDECELENVRADLAFSQMLLETGYLKFGNRVKINQFNFAGLGVTGNEPGIDFSQLYGDSIQGLRMGIRAQVQHLKAYSSNDQLVEDCVDPTFSQVARSSCPTIGGLAGTRPNDSNYVNAILKILNRIQVN